MNILWDRGERRSVVLSMMEHEHIQRNESLIDIFYRCVVSGIFIRERFEY